MRDRIRPPKQYDAMLNDLTGQGLFETRQKAMMFAASLGYRAFGDEDAVALDKYGEGVSIGVFSRATDDVFIDALAVTKCESLNILHPNEGDRRLEIFEYFVSRGLELIDRHCFKQKQSPLEGILWLIDTYGKSEADSNDLPGIEDSLRELGKMM